MSVITEKLTGEEVMAIWDFDKEVPRQGYKVIGEVPADLREEWEDLAFEAQELYFKRPGKGQFCWELKPYDMVKEFVREIGNRPEKLFEEITKRVPGFEVGKTRVFAGWVLANRVMSSLEFIHMLDRMDALLNPFDHHHPYHDRSSCRLCCDG